MKYGIVFKDELYTVEKLLVIDTKLKEIVEDQHVGFQNATDYIQVLHFHFTHELKVELTLSSLDRSLVRRFSKPAVKSSKKKRL